MTWTLGLLVLFGWGPQGDAADPQRGRQEVTDPGLSEEVRVHLVEVRLLVTDKRGNPITDLRSEEVTVYEGGVRQELAFLEKLSRRKSHDPASAMFPLPVPLYTSEGTRVEADRDAVVPPPPAVRRVVFAFDVRNSKLNVRDDWREAALDWVIEGMQPEDQVGVVVFHTYSQWVLRPTDDRNALAAALDRMVLTGNAPNRDRREELTRIIDEIRGLCTDAGRVRTPGRGQSGSGAAPVGDEEDCSYQIVWPYVTQWQAESNETIAVLRTLTGELAAVPGQKIVILFSEGIIPDAGAAGTNAMMGVFGVGRINFRDLMWRMKADSYRELTELHRSATAADVAFFTFDTRSAADGSSFANLEQASMLSASSLALNPWLEMYEATRTTLSTLAETTGGRPSYGRHKLAQKIKAATDSFFGIYAIGYYRSNPAAQPGKLRIKVDRKRTLTTYRERPDLGVHRVTPLQFDLSIGRPQWTGEGELRELPISLQTAMKSLPLRRGAGGYGCQLGVFVQAVRPDGSIAYESFETATAFVDRKTWMDLDEQPFRYRTRLMLPPGAYRVRARISDERQDVIGDRSIDITVTGDGVEAGLKASGSE